MHHFIRFARRQDGRNLVSSKHQGPKNAGAAKWLMAALVVLGTSVTANAQLRSGGRSRSLYSQSVRPASAVRPTADEQVSTAGAAISDATRVAPASCSTCDGGGESLHYESGYVDSGYQVTHNQPIAGHGCALCDSGVSCSEGDCGFHDLAPCATSQCLPAGCLSGGGSLLSLWCRLSVRAEVPLYWRRAASPPPLVTTSPVGTAPGTAGRLPAGANTSVLLGGDSLGSDASAGFRLTLGTWLGENRRFGLLLRYFDAGDDDQSFSFSSNTTPILARPFFNTSVAGSFEQDAQLIAHPDESIGSIDVQTTSSVSGLDLALRRLIYQDRFTRLDWLYGYKHIDIEEGLFINSQTTVTGNLPGLQGASIAVRDSFMTDNTFHGVSYGLLWSRNVANLKFESKFRLGAGNLRRRVNIMGSTTTTSNAGAVSTSGQGLLARNTNNQPFESETFVVIPEVAFNAAYGIRPGLDFNVGYEFMLIPKVAQASEQINDDLSVNLSDPIVGQLDPALNFAEHNYGLHSLGLGLQLRY